MIDQELTDYIKVLHLQNETDENAKNKLKALNKWTSQDIDQALQPINENLNQATKTQSAVEILTDTQKSPISKIIFVLFCLLSFSVVIGIGVQLISLFNEYRLQEFPVIYIQKHIWVVVMPIILAFMTTAVIYTTLKIRVLNKKSWILGLITVVTFPFLNLITVELIKYGMSNNKLHLISSLKEGMSTPEWLFVFVLNIVIFLILIFSANKTNEGERRFSKIEKIFFLIPSLVFIISSLFLSIYQITTLNKILNYEFQAQIQPSTTFKIYSIPKLKMPIGYYFSSDVSRNQSILDIDGAIRTTINKGNSEEIVLVQVGVDKNLDLESFLKDSQEKTERSLKEKNFTNIVRAVSNKIELKNSKDGSAYLMTNDKSMTLLFITKENVLIEISSNISLKDIVIKIAESLQ